MLLCRPVAHGTCFLSLVFCLLGVLAPRAAAQTLSAPLAYQRAKTGKLLLIDVRTPSEWAATGSPRHARRLIANQPRSVFLARLALLTHNNRSKPIALICARGVRSAEMRETLDLAGYHRVLDVAEGMHGSAAGPGWIARRLPVDRWQNGAVE